MCIRDRIIAEVPRPVVVQDDDLCLEEQTLVDSMPTYDKMTNDQICIAAQLLLNEAQRLEDGEYSTSTVSRMFVDCIDRTMTRSKVLMTGAYPQFSSAASAASASEKKTVHTAMIAIDAEANSGTDDDLPALVGTPPNELSPTPVEFTKTRSNELAALAYVNPFKDPGIWAILDEGCNSSTHTRTWREDAEAKWLKKGFKCYISNPKSAKFTGIGQTNSTGRYKLPMALKLEESGEIIPGAVDSHETEAKPNVRPHPLLLSLSLIHI